MKKFLKYLLVNIIFYISFETCRRMLSDIEFYSMDRSYIYLGIVCLVNIVTIILVEKAIIKSIYIVYPAAFSLLLSVAALFTHRAILIIVPAIFFVITSWIYYKFEKK